MAGVETNSRAYSAGDIAYTSICKQSAWSYNLGPTYLGRLSSDLSAPLSIESTRAIESPANVESTTMDKLSHVRLPMRIPPPKPCRFGNEMITQRCLNPAVIVGSKTIISDLTNYTHTVNSCLSAPNILPSGEVSQCCLSQIRSHLPTLSIQL
jgi:hypothetical protein